MGLGEIVGFVIIVSMFVFAFSFLSQGLDEMEAGCIGENTTTVGCELISEESPFSLILTNRILLFMIMAVPFWMIFGRTFMRIFRGIGAGISDYIESYPSDDDDNEKKKYLKDTKSKLKKELNRRSSNNTDTKPEEDKGVQWGSGVDLGEGMKDYEK